jgi:hypothetical protein
MTCGCRIRIADDSFALNPPPTPRTTPTTNVFLLVATAADSHPNLQKKLERPGTHRNGQCLYVQKNIFWHANLVR